MSLFEQGISLSSLKLKCPYWSDTGDILAQRHQNQNISLKTLLYVIQEIPYGRPKNNSLESILAECKGTCSGKHLLAKEILDFIGIPSQLVMASYKVSPLSAPKFVGPLTREFWVSIGPIRKHLPF